MVTKSSEAVGYREGAGWSSRRKSRIEGVKVPVGASDAAENS